MFTLPDQVVHHSTCDETVVGDVHVLDKWLNGKYLLVAAVYEPFNLHLLNIKT